MNGKGSNGWLRAYCTAPQVLADFARAEDPDGKVADAVVAAAAPAGTAVLELGCGSGGLGLEVARRGGAASWIAVDASAPLLRIARPDVARMSLLQARAEALPLAADSRDAVFAAWVLAYLSPRSLSATLAECARILRPGASVWAVENAAAGAAAMPCDGRIDALLAAGFQPVATIDTELRFPDREQARTITAFLMGDGAPPADPAGRIPHRIQLLRRVYP
jgi:SAM-dependent methyltransferase